MTANSGASAYVIDPVTHRDQLRRIGYNHYLRTGRVPVEIKSALGEDIAGGYWVKFNPYHDPRNGQFTFAPGHPNALSNAVISERHGRYLSEQRTVKEPTSATAESSTPAPGEAARTNGEPVANAQLAQYRPNPRVRMGGNNGPPLNDPMTLERVFPGLNNAPGGSLVAIADNILDISGPGQRLTTELTAAHANKLIRDIKAIDPNYHLDTAGFPTTFDGQTNLIRQLQFDRAAAFYRMKGETRPLQVETLRLMQERADRAYIEGQALFETGHLQPRLSREEAIGNYVDRMVRRELRRVYNLENIDHSRGQKIRVNGREYDGSGGDLTFRIPDARVGNIAFDVTLTRKTPKTPQIRGFFNSDFKPNAVIIIRPSQLGPNSTYAIAKPGE